MISFSLKDCTDQEKLFRLLDEDYKLAEQSRGLAEKHLSLSQIMTCDQADLINEQFLIINKRSTKNREKKQGVPSGDSVSIVKIQKVSISLQGKKCTAVLMIDRSVNQELYVSRQMVNLLKMLQATVSHDMISPLNLINMYLNLLENMP